MDTDNVVERASTIGMVDRGGYEETPGGSSEQAVSRRDDGRKSQDAKTELGTATDTGLLGAGDGEGDNAKRKQEGSVTEEEAGRSVSARALQEDADAVLARALQKEEEEGMSASADKTQRQVQEKAPEAAAPEVGARQVIVFMHTRRHTHTPMSPMTAKQAY